ncbi:hypothetical protein [Mycolicibacterium sp. P9-22]|uniref:hypothetical protein n=1 Tax=Mycolicibacterium sp. P9-22 TaxID=2024613 RepID=UPI0011ED04BF|nr:hypothetical protein [Mycolicibacterium sp. P9-22]
MPRTQKKLKQGQIALVCDDCAELVHDDDGYLCVIDGHDSVKRWRVLHDGCSLGTPGCSRSAISEPIVRSGRVVTYTGLLAVLADLSTDGAIGFSETSWPALLLRLAFDTEWELNGRRPLADLEAENRSALKAAGFSRELLTSREVERERERREKTYDGDRRQAKRFVSETAGHGRIAFAEGN